MNDIPQWQQDLVMARLEQARLHPELMLNWDEVSKTLDTGPFKKTKSDIKKLYARRSVRFTKF